MRTRPTAGGAPTVRARTAVAWCVIPGLLLVLATCWSVSRAVENDRRELGGLAARSVRADAVEEARIWVTS